jgi:hypothetical protein
MYGCSSVPRYILPEEQTSFNETIVRREIELSGRHRLKDVLSHDARTRFAAMINAEVSGTQWSYNSIDGVMILSDSFTSLTKTHIPATKVQIDERDYYETKPYKSGKVKVIRGEAKYLFLNYTEILLEEVLEVEEPTILHPPVTGSISLDDIAANFELAVSDVMKAIENRENKAFSKLLEAYERGAIRTDRNFDLVFDDVKLLQECMDELVSSSRYYNGDVFIIVNIDENYLVNSTVVFADNSFLVRELIRKERNAIGRSDYTLNGVWDQERKELKISYDPRQYPELDPARISQANTLFFVSP